MVKNMECNPVRPRVAILILMKKKSHSGLAAISRGRVIVLVLFLLLLYVTLPRMGNFSESFSALTDATILPLFAAGVFLALTFVVSGAIYWLLALRPISYGRMFVVQLSSAFTNRVLPAGVGGPVLIVQYLHRSGFRLPESLAMVGANAVLGWVAHGVLLVLGLSLVGTDALPAVALPWQTIGLSAAVTAGLLAAIGLILPELRRRIGHFLHETGRSLTTYREHPGKLSGALIMAAVLTLCYVAMFYLSAQSLQIALPWSQCFIIFTMGIVTGAAIPLPGGLVGVEAGLAGGLIVYGIDPMQAVAVALLYRLITFWLPLVPSFVAFMVTRKWYV